MDVKTAIDVTVSSPNVLATCHIPICVVLCLFGAYDDILPHIVEITCSTIDSAYTHADMHKIYPHSYTHTTSVYSGVINRVVAYILNLRMINVVILQTQ